MLEKFELSPQTRGWSFLENVQWLGSKAVVLQAGGIRYRRPMAWNCSTHNGKGDQTAIVLAIEEPALEKLLELGILRLDNPRQHVLSSKQREKLIIQSTVAREKEP